MNFNLNFPLTCKAIISRRFQDLSIFDFKSAALYVKSLPYRRNLNKDDQLCLFTDSGGTCSTKHALLKKLSLENNISDLRLMLGIFLMNKNNTPKIAAILEKYHLVEIPEAHNYLRYQNEIGDFTTKNAHPENFLKDLVQETEISPDQITTFKVQYHQSFLRNYLKENPQIPYSLAEFWQIREECIAALQQ